MVGDRVLFLEVGTTWLPHQLQGLGSLTTLGWVYVRFFKLLGEGMYGEGLRRLLACCLGVSHLQFSGE
jgi:hypothetical protein